MADDKSWTKEKIKSRIDGNELDLSLCGISKVPVNSLLPFSKITVLDLSCNKIHILPDSFTKLTNLIQLDLSKNSLTELPVQFGELIKLKKIDLLENHISALPLSFRLLKNLIWLDLKGNPIQEVLPSVVGDCLKPKECQQCATNIISYHEDVYQQLVEKERKKRRKEEEKVTKQLREEDVLRQRRKEEKKRRNEDKKSSQQQQQNECDDQNTLTESMTSTKGNNTVKTSSSSLCYRCFMFLSLFLVVVGLAVYVVYEGNVIAIKQSAFESKDKIISHMNKLFKDTKIK